MTLPNIAFAKPASPKGTVVVFMDDGLRLGPRAAALGLGDFVKRAVAAADFKAKAMATLDLLAPPSAAVDRLLVVGLGDLDKLKAGDWLNLGGAAFGGLRKGKGATILLERPDGEPVGADEAAEFALGAALRAYSFDKYKGEDDDNPGAAVATLTIAVEDAARVRKAWTGRLAVAEGVHLARDVVNEPANVLGPVEFADRIKALEAHGLAVEVLTEKDLRKLGMGAYLGVSQGSPRPPRLVVMRWDGGKPKEKVVAFVGKGVVFDAGGISIKPAGGMEDMKGDMGGAAAVVGTMTALALRKARVNAVGIVGLVENMPDGAAQRPGDIIRSMSGQTVEVINTDAEGRLVLADLLTYVQQRFAPRFMVDLATLTGAIIVALGHHYAGLFSNDDQLAAALAAAGDATGERLWRMPLGPEYDKMIDSKFADMKNVGGRDAGSVTAAQFIQRFVKDTPWAHLDIAGTAMGSPASETNRSWASGFGVRLLDRLVADRYES